VKRGVQMAMEAELKEVVDVGGAISPEDSKARQKYALLILHIVCGRFDKDQKQAFVVEAKKLAIYLDRNYGTSLAYAALVFRIVCPDKDDVDDDGDVSGSLLRQAEIQAQNLKKNLDQDVRTVRMYIEKGHGHA
jgi:hypothetical protein